MSVQHLKDLKANGITGELLGREMQHISHILGDKLFLLTGVESEDLDANTERLQLEEDAEYQKMVREYTEKVQGINLGGN